MNKIDKNFGINRQALAVLNYLPDEFKFIPEQEYPFVQTKPWYNGRESGVVVSLNDKDYTKVLHIAWFEHRNSDNICCLKWETKSHYWNHPLENKDIWINAYGGEEKTKYDTAASFHYGQVSECANWICEQFEEFYKERK